MKIRRASHWTRHAAVSSLRASVIGATVALAMTACAPVPISPTGQLAEADKTTLIGSSEQDVRDLLGAPKYTVGADSSAYLMYEAEGTEEGVFMLTHPVFYIFLAMVGEGPVFAIDVLHCLLVELRDGEVVQAKLESVPSSPAASPCTGMFAGDAAFVSAKTDWGIFDEREAALADCGILRTEIAATKRDITLLMPSAHISGAGENFLTAVAGSMLLVPLMTQGTDRAQRAELAKLREAYSHLEDLAERHACDFEVTPLTEIKAEHPPKDR